MTTTVPDYEASPDVGSKIKKVRSGPSRRTMFIALAGAVVVLGAGYFAYEHFFAATYVSTDNAYVGADVAQVTSQVAGPVAEVLVGDTRIVKRGDILVRLDDSDARLRLAGAEADLQLAERRVRGYLANDRALGAQVSARAADNARAAADIASAQADLEKARIDLERRTSLAESGSVSGDELTTAQTAYRTSVAALASARAAQAQATANRSAADGTREVNAALIQNAAPEDNPEVLTARAARDQARLDLERTVIRAPVDGVISRRQVQVGQRVQPGMMMMMVVPIEQAYVDANLKEIQLKDVRVGQPVTLTSDLYGDAVEYTGRVVGFSGGTGAAFAVVPAQNATGNWIKVVQRLPVRIALDPAQLREHPLQVGLSMNVRILASDH